MRGAKVFDNGSTIGLVSVTESGIGGVILEVSRRCVSHLGLASMIPPIGQMRARCEVKVLAVTTRAH